MIVVFRISVVFFEVMYDKGEIFPCSSIPLIFLLLCRIKGYPYILPKIFPQNCKTPPGIFCANSQRGPPPPGVRHFAQKQTLGFYILTMTKNQKKSGVFPSIYTKTIIPTKIL